MFSGPPLSILEWVSFGFLWNELTYCWRPPPSWPQWPVGHTQLWIFMKRHSIANAPSSRCQTEIYLIFLKVWLPNSPHGRLHSIIHLTTFCVYVCLLCQRSKCLLEITFPGASHWTVELPINTCTHMDAWKRATKRYTTVSIKFSVFFPLIFDSLSRSREIQR